MQLMELPQSVYLLPSHRLLLQTNHPSVPAFSAALNDARPNTGRKVKRGKVLEEVAGQSWRATIREIDVTGALTFQATFRRGFVIRGKQVCSDVVVVQVFVPCVR
jgi:hypothetical protein